MAEPTDEGMSRRYVRTFLFSMRINSPLAKLHVISKVVTILATSVLIVRLMDAHDPDPLGAGLLMGVGLASLLLSGAGRWLYHSYLVVIFPMLIVIFATWIIFNPHPGTITYFSLQLYDGTFDIRLTPWLPLCLGVTYVVWRLSRLWWLGLLLGIAIAQGAAQLSWWPLLPLTQVVFFRPLTLVISDTNLLVALTKVMGYAAMVFVSLTLIMTTRDIEFIGAMQQLRAPYVATFFLSIILRTLNSAVMDYEAIQQAQVARGLNLQPRSLFRRLRDLAQLSVPLVATMIRRSTEVSDAVLARGFHLGQVAPTEYREAQALRASDWAILAFQGLLLALVFGLSINLTHVVGWE
jgi:energy-coupling factor transporter transmembrane protein EcfT